MFFITEADAAAIRAAYHQGGELSATVEVHRLFLGVDDMAKARSCARIIAAWEPRPARSPYCRRRGVRPFRPAGVNRDTGRSGRADCGNATGCGTMAPPRRRRGHLRNRGTCRLDLPRKSPLLSPGLTLGVGGFNQRLSAVSGIQQPQAHVSW
jgi:hypothetical protein